MKHKRISTRLKRLPNRPEDSSIVLSNTWLPSTPWAIHRSGWYSSLLLGGMWFLTCLGCGDSNPRTYPVQGRVVFDDGQVVQQGSVEFRLDSEVDRVVARGKIASDGSFSLSTFEPGDGALPGEHQVIVQQLIIAEGFAAGHQHGPRVPAVYAEYGRSGLKAKVKPEPINAIEIKLKP
jgi:hypothetical protein